MTSPLQTLISDYSNSLTRIEGEKDLMSRIAVEAELQCRIKPTLFKKVAMAFHKDNAKNTRDDLQEQVDLFDQLLS